MDDGPREKQKSSGVTICTGTGSSSWHFHINHLYPESVQQILKIGKILKDQQKYFFFPVSFSFLGHTFLQDKIDPELLLHYQLVPHWMLTSSHWI